MVADHRLAHPEPVEGCFGCHVLGIGFQSLQSRHGANPIETRRVIGDDGPRAGRVVGEHHVHWNGRQDAVARPGTLKLKMSASEEA